ncbi:MAG: DUF2027 domain-containing protein [Bacteroidetes bacterium]|nr:DUF2027 domain-containing protein [Bacteroidota bacterium]
MAIKVGDKVKFLNATGGGVVRSIIDSRLVSVAIEGGFEIPVQASELLVIDPVDAGSRFFHESFDVPDIPQSSDPGGVSLSSSDGPEDLPRNVISSRRSEELFLVFVPHDQKWLITGNLDVFLVNNTSYDVLYNLFRKADDGSWSGVDYGSQGAGTRLLMATIHRDDLPLWTEGAIQFLFHREKCKQVPPPFHAEFSITGKKFYSEQNYRDSVYVAGKGMVVKIATVSADPEEKKSGLTGKASSVKETKNSDDFIQRHKTGEREAVVDLHIHELVDDPAGFEKVEILEFQKNYFIRCLESAIASGFLKVTFIHGVGNGVLRDVVMDILKKQEGIEVFDAPMQKYGVGALEVQIRHNQ